jgi:cardiolipin synthase
MPYTSLTIKRSYTWHNRVALVPGGSAYFSRLLALIRKAERSIHLQTYIFEADETGILVAEALKTAAQKGVQVYLLLDGYASGDLPVVFQRELLDAGIHFRFFEPLLRSERFYFGRRLHHKILVVDQRFALVGGVNISNRYNDMPGQPAWLDWAVFTEGEIAQELFKVCVSLWFKSSKMVRNFMMRHPPLAFPVNWECAIRVRRNDWVRQLNQISGSYLDMFRRAENHVWIMSSYFLPGRIIRKSLINAIQRGVSVTVILAGTSDVPIAKYAERFIYRWLLRQGVRIYEYPKAVLHAKLSVYDRKWVTVGSYNVNNISAYASVELNLDIRKDAFALGVEKELRRIMEKECIEITGDQLNSYTTSQRLMQWFSYELYRFVFFLFTFYFRQQAKG